MRRAGSQHETAQALHIGMRHDGVHQALAIAFSPVLFQHIHINKIGKRGVVADHAGERHLAAIDIAAKTERMVDRALRKWWIAGTSSSALSLLTFKCARFK